MKKQKFITPRDIATYGSIKKEIIVENIVLMVT